MRGWETLTKLSIRQKHAEKTVLWKCETLLCYRILEWRNMQKGTITVDVFLLMILVQSLAERFADVSSQIKENWDNIDILHPFWVSKKTRRATQSVSCSKHRGPACSDGCLQGPWENLSFVLGDWVEACTLWMDQEVEITCGCCEPEASRGY